MGLRYKIWKKFAFLTAPRMIWGYKTLDGRILRNTRVSNATFIDHRENLVMDDHVYIGHFNYLEASHGITIGEGCQITNFVTITSHSSHNSLRVYGRSYIKTEKPAGYETGKVEIGKYCFIGPHSVIMPGTHIGKGSIVSAFSYVQGEFPPFSVIRGNPAKVVGSSRDADEELIREHPELRDHYNEWAKENGDS